MIVCHFLEGIDRCKANFAAKRLRNPSLELAATQRDLANKINAVPITHPWCGPSGVASDQSILRSQEPLAAEHIGRRQFDLEDDLEKSFQEVVKSAVRRDLSSSPDPSR
jgi:hypothetical protein